MLDRPIQKAEAGIDKLKGGTHRLDIFINGWLSGFECHECGEDCTAETEFVAEQAMHVSVWVCSECGSRYYRTQE